MPLIILNQDLTLGHGPGCWGPAPVNATTCTNVTINNKTPVIEGDSFSTHQNPENCGDLGTHTPSLVPSKMSTSVFINGKKVLRDSDILSCGDSINSAGGNVFCEGGPILGPGGQGGGGGTSINFTVGRPIIESFPQVTYRRKVQFINLPLSNTIQIIFLNWCSEPSYFRAVAYTPITDTVTNTVYRNDPVLGAPNLPSYAPNYLRDPITINFYIDNLGDQLPNGLSLSTDGILTGLPVQSNPINKIVNNILVPLDINLRATNIYTTTGVSPATYIFQLGSSNVTNC